MAKNRLCKRQVLGHHLALGEIALTLEEHQIMLRLEFPMMSWGMSKRDYDKEGALKVP